MNKNDWLLNFSENVFSQRGEDGILKKIFEIINIKDPWCVEFGAWDGKHLSNTHELIKHKNWSGVFIESEKKCFVELCQTYEGNPKAFCLNEFITFGGNSTLDAVLSRTPIKKDFALLSIDIDGNDYHIWDSLKKYCPQVVVIEYNPTIPNNVEFVQAKDMSVSQGSSLLSIAKLGKNKGYELVSVTPLNAIFVLKEHFSKFEITDNSINELNPNRKNNAAIFYLYDGTIVLHGHDVINWHGVKIKQSRLQQIPKIFRVFPGRMSGVRLFMFKVWRKLSR
jgi:hypothetical protein